MFKELLFTIICFTIIKCGITQNNKLIIDNDAGGDDAMAIFLALLYEKYYDGPKLIGLTTGNGNTNEDNVYINNQKILKIAHRQDVPIYRGSRESLIITPNAGSYYGQDGLGDNDEAETDLLPAQKQTAVLALIELSKKHEDSERINKIGADLEEEIGYDEISFCTIKIIDRPTNVHFIQDELVVITIGTLTNVALAIKSDPQFLGRLSHLYVGAGHIHNEDNPQAEFNAHMDVEAYHIITQHATPEKVTIFPFSQTKASLNFTKQETLQYKDTIENNSPRAKWINITLWKIWMNESDRRYLLETWREEVLGKIDTDTIRSQNKYERVSLNRGDDWMALDPSVVAIVVKPDLVQEYKYSKNGIILSGDKRGINTNTFVEKEDANVRIVYSVKTEEYKQFLIDVFSAEVKEKKK